MRDAAKWAGWVFAARYEGAAPCRVPDWAWSGFGYLDGTLKVATSGPTRAEALKRAAALAGVSLSQEDVR